MASQKVLVKNFYRALYSASFVAGATLVGGPIGAAEATAALVSPLGVATVELAAQQATDFTIGSKGMADGGLITQPTFALLGEAGPEMVIPIDPNRTEAEYMRLRDMARRTKNQTLENQLALESGTRAMKFKKPRSRKQKANDRKKSEAWALANAKGRRKNGSFYAGWDQRRIAEYANKVLKRS